MTVAITFASSLSFLELIWKKLLHWPTQKIQRPRRVEAIKYKVKKYIKRERRKTLPNDVDFWDCGCRFGSDDVSSGVIHLSAINKSISQIEADQLDSFYLEILVKPGYRTKKTIVESQIPQDDANNLIG